MNEKEGNLLTKFSCSPVIWKLATTV